MHNEYKHYALDLCHRKRDIALAARLVQKSAAHRRRAGRIMKWMSTNLDKLESKKEICNADYQY